MRWFGILLNIILRTLRLDVRLRFSQFPTLNLTTTTAEHAWLRQSGSGKKRDEQIEKYSIHAAVNSLEIDNKFIHILAMLPRVSLAVSKNQLERLILYGTAHTFIAISL